MAARLRFQRRAHLGAVAVAVLGALLVVVPPPAPVSAATSSQYAASWTATGTWSLAPPATNPVGAPDNSCTSGDTGATADFTFTGFSIPATDSIDGIEVIVERRSAQSQQLQLVDGGTLVGTPKVMAASGGANNCNDPAAITVGSATDTWGSASLTPAAINDGFGVRLSVTNNPNIRVDSVQMIVHHSATTPEADLSVTVSDDVDPATPGESVTYTIVAANAGPDTDPSATLIGLLPSVDAACTYTSLAAGGATGNTPAGAGNLAEDLAMPSGSSVTYTALCSIASGATNFLIASAQIAASGSVDDPDTTDNSASESTDLAPEADVSVTKTDGTTTAVPGESVTYEIFAANAGPSDDPSVSVADAFSPILSCTYDAIGASGATGYAVTGSGDIADTVSLPAGSSVTYTATCDVDAAATGFLWNTATTTASVTDPNDGNDSATDVDTLTPESGLAVVVDESTDPVTAGDPGGLTYTVTVVNDGPSVAGNTIVEVALTLPPGITAGSATASAGSFAGTTWDVGSLAPVDDETLTLPLAVAGSTAAGTDVIGIEAAVSSDSTDSDDTDDTAAEATSVEAAPVTPTTTTTTTTTPTTTTTTTTTTIASRVQDAGTARGGTSPTGALPRTGGSVGPLVLLGLLSMLGGGLAVWSAERRNAHAATSVR